MNWRVTAAIRFKRGVDTVLGITTPSTEPSPKIVLDLPYPVSVNRVWRSNRGRVHLSQEYQQWIRDATVEWYRQKRGLSTRSISSGYVMELVATPPDKRHRDLGNLEKAASDFIQRAGIVANDSLARKITIEWADPPYAIPCIVLTVSPKPYG